MRLLVLAVLAASVCCIVVPINGQSSRKNPGTDKAKASDSQPPKIDTVNVDTVNVTKLNVEHQPETQRKPDGNGKESESYLSRLIAPENLPNLILCMVGIAGVGAAIFTLKAINRQADLMKDQWTEMKAAGVQAAKQIALAEQNIKIIISKERGRLRLEAIKLTLPDVSTPLATVEYAVRLYGATDAIIRTTIADAIVSDSEEPPSDIPLSQLFIPKIISPSDSPFVTYQLVTPPENMGLESDAIRQGSKFVHFWGSILYDDVFGDHHYTNFRFVWHPLRGATQNGNPVGRWSTCGPAEDNRAI